MKSFRWMKKNNGTIMAMCCVSSLALVGTSKAYQTSMIVSPAISCMDIGCPPCGESLTKPLPQQSEASQHIQAGPPTSPGLPGHESSNVALLRQMRMAVLCHAAQHNQQAADILNFVASRLAKRAQGN